MERRTAAELIGKIIGEVKKSTMKTKTIINIRPCQLQRKIVQFRNYTGKKNKKWLEETE